jgi:hypothetical protein
LAEKPIETVSETPSGTEAAALKAITKNIVAEHHKKIAVLADRKGAVG